MGFSQGSAFGINGCKVADGGREDSNGLLIGFSLLGVSGQVFCDYLIVCEAFQLVTRHNTTLSLVALLLPSFFYGLSLNLAFGTLECVLWRLENLAVGWRWRWVCLETVCDQFWHALPPFGGSVVAHGALTASTEAPRASFFTLVKRTVMFTSAASSI